MVTTTRVDFSKVIYTAVLICLAVIIAYPVYAKEATPSTTRKEKVQERIETRKEDIKQRAEAVKEKVETRVTAMKEKIATREATLKARLAAFKDKRKAEIAERVNTNLNKINQNQTDQMLKHLDRMSELLNKLEARVNSGSPDIKDATAAKQAISDSKAKIAAAIEAVKAQAGIDYTLTVTSESKVKAEAQAMREKLRTDLQTVKKQVIDAKQSVSNAIRVAKAQAKEATTSGQ